MGEGSQVHVTVSVNIRGHHRQESRLVAGALTVLFVAWVSGWLWWLIAAAGVAAVCYWVQCRGRAIATERAALAARADQQHAWTREGDPRGTYGEALTPSL